MLPSGYTQLEYIESSGTQYIDTGIIPDENTRISASFQAISFYGTFNVVFGSRDSSGKNGIMLYAQNSTTSYCALYGAQYLEIPGVTLNTDTQHICKFERNVIELDGNTATAGVQNFTGVSSFTVFCMNQDGLKALYGSFRLFSCQIYDNDVLSLDFVPCLNASGEAGLYDLVSGQFYGNAGTGVFSAGPSVAGNSIQETNLRAIADAIREKEGSTGAIAAEDFAARILALQDSESGYSMPLRLETNPGASVTAQNGEDVLTGTADEDGNLTFLLPKPGTWTVTAALDGREKTRDVTVEDYALNFASRLPEGYQEVKYIHTVTATSFNSDISVTSSNVFRTFRVVMDFEADTYTGSASQVLFNSTNFSYVSGSKFAYQVFRNSASQLAYYLGNASAVAYASINISNTRLMFDCDMAEQTFKVGSDVFTFGAATGTLKTWTPVLFASPSGGNAIPGKLYAAKMWLSGELVRDFVPCIDPSGVVGLYDLVNGVFYKNSRNGALTAGPAV